MQPPPFELERYFARWEFSAPYLLCSSDMEPWTLRQLLALASPSLQERWEALTLGYTESSGMPELRQAIAGLYGGVSPEEILTFAGAQEAVLVAMNVLLGPGDHAVVVWPGYQSLYELARSAGAEVTLLPLREEEGWRLDLDALRRALRPNTRAIVVNFPHNPTGALPDPVTFRALAQLAEERGLFLFSDEVYRYLEFEEGDRLPAAVELGKRGISLGVMSKAYGLAGLRVGWLASRDASFLQRCAAWKDYSSICNAAPSELLALMALQAQPQILARSRALLARNLALADAFFHRHADQLHWVRPRAGSVAFPRRVEAGSVRAFTERLVREQGVLLLPGDVYGVKAPHFRMGLGRASLPEALARFEAFLKTR